MRVGTGIGGIHTFLDAATKLVEKGPSRISPFFIPMEIPNMPAAQIAIDLKVKGPNTAIVTACSTGSDCIGDAFRTIQYGDADVMLAGGTEAAISPIAVAGFDNMKALSRENDAPEKASCPFDKKRSGFVMGEGAGILVLEELEHAKARGAQIYAELVGYGHNSDAYHITAPDPEGDMQVKCMEMAIKDAGLTPADIDYVLLTHAHIDHSGLLPLLYKRGFKGTIFSTYATSDLCEIMLRDSGHIQEFEAEWRNRKAKRAGKPEYVPLYTIADADGASKLFCGCPYGERIHLADGIDIRFTDVGHLLGSASIEIWATEGASKKKIVFSGDIGNKNTLIHEGKGFSYLLLYCKILL